MSNISVEFSFVSAIRIFRIFKLFKAEKYFKAVSILSLVVKNNKQVLLMTGMLGVITFTLTSTGLWMAEKDNPANPEFDSIPSSMYMAMLMLCGLNIPEHTTPLGKVVVTVTGIFSIAVFAIPTGIIAWGFEPVASEMLRRRKIKKERKRLKKLGLKNPESELSINNEIVEEENDDDIFSTESFRDSQSIPIIPETEEGSNHEHQNDSHHHYVIPGSLESICHDCPHCKRMFFCQYAPVPMIGTSDDNTMIQEENDDK